MNCISAIFFVLFLGIFNKSYSATTDIVNILSPKQLMEENTRIPSAMGNGIADDTIAIQKIIDAASRKGEATILFPAHHTYIISKPIELRSNTHLLMYGATIKPKNGINLQAFFQNYNQNPKNSFDHNIVIEGGDLDYGAGIRAGGSHAILMKFVNNVIIKNVVGHGRFKQGTFIAFIGTTDGTMEGNKAYNYITSTYDAWWNPKNIKIIGNYAETGDVVQIFNINPEDTTALHSNNFLATNILIEDNRFVCLKKAGCPMQIEPLVTGTMVENVKITGNYFFNSQLYIRGNVNNINITNNTFDSSALKSGPIIVASDHYGKNGKNITVDGNKFVKNPFNEKNVFILRAENSSTKNNHFTRSGN
jgi:polygalacturonase